jgi:hypothetical protein
MKTAVMRLLAAIKRLPLVEAIRGYEAAPVVVGGAEGGLRAHGLGAGVDHAVARLFLLGPGWNETPTEQNEHSALLFLAYRRGTG